MANRSKLEKITELNTLPNVFQEPAGLKGHWHEEIFENDNPIVVEVGCGRGEYTIALARKYPEKNFIGIDVKGPRLWKGAKTLYTENRTNGAFIRTLIERITDYFAPGEVSELWITFPDPYPQPAKAMKRLISVRFLELYRQILKEDGVLNFKTDNTGLFQYAVDTFKLNPGIHLEEFTFDLDNSPLLNEITGIRTTYEQIFRAEGQAIKYCRFHFVPGVPLASEAEINAGLNAQKG